MMRRGKRNEGDKPRLVDQYSDIGIASVAASVRYQGNRKARSPERSNNRKATETHPEVRQMSGRLDLMEHPSEECRARAEHCFRRAANTPEPERSKFLELANAWRELADEGVTSVPREPAYRPVKKEP